MIGWNKLTGSIPTEVGLLTNLDHLRLGKHLFSALLLCFETKQIRYYYLTLIVLFATLKILIAKNKLSGTIPTEVGLLTELKKIELSKLPSLSNFPPYKF